MYVGESYYALNENPKSPYKKKEVEKRLNDIKKGKVQCKPE